MIGLEPLAEEKTYPRTQNGNPRGLFRCCICVEKPVFMWFTSIDLAKKEYGICVSCAAQYTEGDDQLMTLKDTLRNVVQPIIPWSETAEKPAPPKYLEDWEDDLFD